MQKHISVYPLQFLNHGNALISIDPPVEKKAMVYLVLKEIKAKYIESIAFFYKNTLLNVKYCELIAEESKEINIGDWFVDDIRPFSFHVFNDSIEMKIKFTDNFIKNILFGENTKEIENIKENVHLQMSYIPCNEERIVKQLSMVKTKKEKQQLKNQIVQHVIQQCHSCHFIPFYHGFDECDFHTMKCDIHTIQGSTDQLTIKFNPKYVEYISKFKMVQCKGPQEKDIMIQTGFSNEISSLCYVLLPEKLDFENEFYRLIIEFTPNFDIEKMKVKNISTLEYEYEKLFTIYAFISNTLIFSMDGNVYLQHPYSSWSSKYYIE